MSKLDLDPAVIARARELAQTVGRPIVDLAPRPTRRLELPPSLVGVFNFAGR